MLKSSRRLAAIAAVVALGMGNLAVCAGWQSSPEARMACCADEDTCPMHMAESDHSASKRAMSQAQADNCCASAEHHETAPASSTFVLHGVLAIAPNPIVQIGPTFGGTAGIRRFLTPLPRTPVPTHLLLSVFLL